MQFHCKQGFQQQTKSWPQRPVDLALAFLQTYPPSAHVADFGCGDAEIASQTPHNVSSLDLISTKPNVIACNMANTPLQTASVDVAIFSLALMGTDYGLFLEEAARVVKRGGVVWIAEVKSRFVD